MRRYLPWRQLSLANMVVIGCAGLASVLLLAHADLGAAWALVLVFWGAALLAALVQTVAQRHHPIHRYLARHEPLAGPRPGAELPG